MLDPSLLKRHEQTVLGSALEKQAKGGESESIRHLCLRLAILPAKDN